MKTPSFGFLENTPLYTNALKKEIARFLINDFLFFNFFIHFEEIIKEALQGKKRGNSEQNISNVN